MSKGFTRRLAAILGICISVTALAGCNGSSKVDKSKQEVTSTEQKVKWKGKITIAPYMFASVTDDKITPEVEKRLLDYGYDVDLENVYIENNQYAQLINLRIASNDAPDIFRTGGSSVDALVKMQEQGAIAGWTEEFFRKHAPTVAAYMDSGNPKGSNKDYIKTTWAMSKVGDKMYTIPLMSASQGSTFTVAYNKTWLDNLGVKEPPEKLEDFVDLMYKFRNNDPDKNGKLDTHGLSMSMLNVIFGAYGTFPFYMHQESDYPHWYDVNGKLVNADIMPSNKEALSLIAKLYKDRVLDPEFVTGENQGGYWAISHRFVNGKIGVTHNAAINHYMPASVTGTAGAVLAEFKKIQGESADVVFGPFPKGPEGKSGGFTRLPVSPGTVYNKNLEKDQDKLAAIFGLMDVFSKDTELGMLARYGIEGVHYTMQDGGWVKASEGMDNAKLNSQGVMALRCLYSGDAGVPYNDKMDEINLSFPQNKYMDTIKNSRPGMNTAYISKVYTTLPSLARYKEQLKTYRNETWLKMIQGTMPIDQYDEFVKQWNKMGGEQITKEANDWYAKNK